MVVVFLFANGVRNCSMVGATFCLGFEVLWRDLLSEGLKKRLVRSFWFDFAQNEHIQAPSLRARPDIRRGKLFIVSKAAGLDVGRLHDFWLDSDKSTPAPKIYLKNTVLFPISIVFTK
jgi:hypothetical protein